MRCRYVREIFRNRDNGFCIFVYHTESADVPEAARDPHYEGKGTRFTAMGTGLPDTAATETELAGNWVKSKHGLQLQVESYEEILPQTKEGIRGYLSSGMIKGIGPKMAELIVGKFGTRTFDVLDNYPDSLLEIKGITRKKLDGILLSYQGSHAMRDLAAYLTPFKVTPKKIQKIYEEFGNSALDTVKDQPFALCKISGFGFLTVDEIAKANKGKPDDPLRIEGCIWYCMEQDMQEGNLFQDKQQFQRKVYEQLNKGYQGEAVTEMAVYKVLYQLVKDKRMYYESGALYPANMYGYECGAAKSWYPCLRLSRRNRTLPSFWRRRRKNWASAFPRNRRRVSGRRSAIRSASSPGDLEQERPRYRRCCSMSMRNWAAAACC